MTTIQKIPNLVAVWDFKETAGQIRKARGGAEFPLRETDGKLLRISEGPLSGYSALFDSDAYLSLN